MRTILLIISLLVSLSANAKQLYGPYQAEVVRVVDGDTIELNVHVWPGLVQNIKLRLSGVNTPEKRGRNVSQCEKKAAQKATNFTQRWVKGINRIIVTEVKLGKYAGRALGKIKKGELDLGEELIRAGHAKPYSGGRRQAWC
ncbi:MAG: thermonuclease family protein [Gammaproteobacteria bacterium]|nr:thermonuclease family protein [Gammaproteobacteria bacterium]